MPKILIVGGGYAGFYTAWKLEKLLRKGEAEVTLVDPLPYMTYQPFLPEVAAGSIEARHAIVNHRSHLKKTRLISGKVTKINHATKTAVITPRKGEDLTETYDQIVFTAGAVSRTFPIAGIADGAFGLKSIEEAVAVRDRLLSNFEKAAVLPPGPEREKYLTVVVIGGGFAGIETFAELRSLASDMLKSYPELTFEDTHFHLVEAMSRIMPEVSLDTSKWVLNNLAERGGEVHLDTQLLSAEDGNVKLSNGLEFSSKLIIWTAGVMASPTLRATDFPLDDRGRLRLRPDLRVEGDQGIVEGAWGAGDATACPDLSGGGVGGYCVPNAQHAVRQAKLLARNITAGLRGEGPTDYFHKNLGAVAGLGLKVGVFQAGKFALKGYLAWLAHRGYHGLAMPSFERKFRVVGGWWNNFWLGRDIASLRTVQYSRQFFEEFATRPAVTSAPAKPATKKVASKPVAKKPATKPASKPAVKKAAAKSATKATVKKTPTKKPVAQK